MKFGRTIKTSLYAEWADKYLQYSELKKEIKNRMSKNNGAWTDKDEDEFVTLLSKELDKVYDFQKVKVSFAQPTATAFPIAATCTAPRPRS